ncbi:hypothetical protein GMW71_00085 [Pectobacterium brasiliense]|nr:hypothetical protein GMW71_00085 [Pectobacterium brasiliense]
MRNKRPNIVYVIGAGLSAGLGFPTIGNLLPKKCGGDLRKRRLQMTSVKL